jgi:DNA-binding ferritin-like protein (Dps family)
METQEQAVATKADATKLSQKDAVYTFVLAALENKPADGQKLKDLVTKDVRKVVRQRLFASVKSGEIKLSKQFDDSKLKKYCSGLINNWLKKDSRFN